MRTYRLLFVCCMAALAALLVPVAPVTAAPAVAERFQDYYAQHQGWRILGTPLSGLIRVNDTSAQYFEKGRIEDHRNLVSDPQWAIMYGRLTAELMDHAPAHAVNATNVTYAQLRALADPDLRLAAPSSFNQGTYAVDNGIFIPYDPQLRAVPGYIVPLPFWSYINQVDLFPGGWLHDIGLPMTHAFLVNTVKDGEQRQIMMQAFERTVLTYDPQNPQAWQVERGNIGADLFEVPQPDGTIEHPVASARVTLPLHVVAQVGQPGQQVTVTLRWGDGTQIQRSFTAGRASDGNGLLVATLDWRTESRPPQPAAHAATLEIHDSLGVLLARQSLDVLRWDDADVQHVTLYWLADQQLVPVQQPIPRTIRIGTATLDALLWGPRPGNLAGFHTAIPTPDEVQSYAGRTTTWGPRVVLRRLVIEQGVATADFSQELLAFGDDLQRAAQIRSQITATLLQFPTVSAVRITVEGNVVPALTSSY